ncbi:proteasome assembly chaperone 3-like [Babylonia areolata]|uniref:proteasome assembly chaperone 3-like n=1 Tax=Babylonia areolata TaxID=304850 RepID=UPI003FD58D1F
MAAPTPRNAGFPVSSAQAAVSIKGMHTDIHCSVFQNQLYLIVTQFCKLGTLVQVKPETAVNELEGPTPMLSTKVLFGKDEPLIHVMARHIVAPLHTSQPVLLALSLQDTSRDAVFGLLPSIQACVTKALGGQASSLHAGADEVLCR